ncbi:hypothetical protein QTP86_018194 [Hemibagrus guttatus]|nr:hypothetical protein QTP86_018194 [Hemibagrus guttatus]
MTTTVNGSDPKWTGTAPRAQGPNPNPNPSPSRTQLDPPADLEPCSDPQTAISDAKNSGLKFAKSFLLVFPVYVLGYLGFSFSWILISLAVLFWLRRNQGARFSGVNKALAFFEHEEKAAKQRLPTSELPPWVHFPDVERVEWLNKTVHQMWPYICQFVDKLFRETIEPSIKGANAHLSSFCFSKIDMGDKALRVNGVKVYTENVDKRQIIMDLQISFVGNTEIDVEIKKYYCRAGITSIQLHGMLRVVMEPLLGDMPLIGALSVFFLKKPLLDFNWTGLTNMLDIPGLNGLCDGVIEDIICSYLVLPQRITIPLVGEAQLAQLRFPMPKGVLRVHFLEAQDLLAKDRYLGGLIKGKSDPYGVIKIGNQLFQSKVIKDCLHPKWNEVYEALVYDNSAQSLEIELFDEDPDEDDFLGRLSVDLNELEKEQKVDEWFVLDEVASGKLHLKLEWLSPLATPEKLDQVLSSIRADKGQANDGLSSALLLVHLDSGKNLPSAKKVTSDPSPLVQFKVGHTVFESKTRYKTNEPVWEEAFTFLIHNPKSQDLEVEVKDERHECTLGTFSLPLTQLLQAEQMTMNQRFPLKSAGPSATLKMKIALRVLSLERFTVSQQPSVQVHRSSNAIPSASNSSLAQNASKNTIKTSGSGVSSKPSSQLPHVSEHQSVPDLKGLSESTSSTPLEDSPIRLSDAGRSTSNLAISGSQMNLNSKEPTPSIASDISHPYASQELQQRIKDLQNGSTPGHFPLGEIELTIRHSSQRNKLIVVVHRCRFEFSVSLVELHRRTLDVAVKNGGGLLSKHKGLLGKVMVDLTSEDISKSWTQWYELSEDGLRKPSV